MTDELEDPVGGGEGPDRIYADDDPGMPRVLSPEEDAEHQQAMKQVENQKQGE